MRIYAGGNANLDNRHRAQRRYLKARTLFQIPLALVLISIISLSAAAEQPLCDSVAHKDIAMSTVTDGPIERNDDVALRVARRTFPSVFQAWNGILVDGKQINTPEAIAKHDLVWHAPEFFGARWTTQPAFMATTLIPASQDKLHKRLGALRAMNPAILLLASLTYWEAPANSLPADSPFWLRDSSGRVVPGWDEGGYLRLDLRNQELRDTMIARAQALTVDGLFDGILLDMWNENDQAEIRRDFLIDIKHALRPGALIFANVNYRTSDYSAKYLNGVFLESVLPCAPGCGVKTEAEEWRRLAKTMLFYGRNLQPPRLIATEIWRCNARQSDRADCDVEDAAHPDRMLAATAMALTLSNGYVLFSEPNVLPVPDHLHLWYPEWEQKIGRPKGPASCERNGVVQREFDGATVYFNATDASQTVASRGETTTLAPWRGLIVRTP